MSDTQEIMLVDAEQQQAGESQDLKNYVASVDAPIALKYIAAGRIAQSVVSVLVREISEQRLSNVFDICAVGNYLVEEECGKIFKNVEEKGVANPTCVDVNNCIWGYSPVERENAYVLTNGDIAKISLGVHIDGYSSLVTHTLVVLPTVPVLEQTAPTTGVVADVVCATHLATEAVVTLLGTTLQHAGTPSGFFGARKVNGLRIKEVVENVAKAFKVKILPGSQVRRIKRFLVGQDTVHEVDVKGYAWGALSIEEATDDPEEGDLKKLIDSEAAPELGEAWVVDLAMCSFSGLQADLNPRNEFQVSRRTIKPHRALKPTIFTRDYSKSLSMKLKSARGVLTEIDNRKSVFPFHLSALETEGAPLGVAALVKMGILSPATVFTVQGAPGTPVSSRTRTTVLLAPSVKYGGELVRLSGGEIAPSWVHSEYEITDAEILELLDEKRAGVRVRNIGAVELEVPALEGEEEDAAMEIE
ncbi:hypothetical protein BZA70DRAFT_276770 [Myxozyma melibiosi]|uniref:Probable metalloprotease ARX1 n=1 Tax=Myxozyma melibiosi TaxID=54550 RepID=A0ABR1F794_9ASCO